MTPPTNESGRHDANVIEYEVPVRTPRSRRVKYYRTLRRVECSCGQHIGSGLDFIDARRRWREHVDA